MSGTLHEVVREYGLRKGTYDGLLPSYGSVFGAGIRQDMSAQKYLLRENPLHPEETADLAALTLVGRLFSAGELDSKTKLNIHGRSVMERGKTKPVKVSAEVFGNVQELYVKRFDPGRVFGIEAYNLLSGHPPLEYRFSDGVVVELPVGGEQEGMEKWFKKLPRELAEEAVRIGVLSQIIGLADVAPIKNASLNCDYHLFLFDFDESFKPVRYVFGRDLGVFSNQEVENIVKHEKASILLRARRSQEDINELIEAMNACDFNAQFLRPTYRNAGDFLRQGLNSLEKMN